MKVRELQEKLTGLDPELEILCYSEDEELAVENRLVCLFNVINVTTVQAETSRLDDGHVALKFDDKAPNAKTLGLLEITSDF